MHIAIIIDDAKSFHCDMPIRDMSVTVMQMLLISEISPRQLTVYITKMSLIIT